MGSLSICSTGNGAYVKRLNTAEFRVQDLKVRKRIPDISSVGRDVRIG